MTRHTSRMLTIASLALAALFFSSSSCQETPPEPPKTDPTIYTKDSTYDAKIYLRNEYMNQYYYWYKQVIQQNNQLNAANYDIYEFFDKMLYSADRWSWMCDKEYYVSSETGTYTGTWGVSLTQATDYYGSYAIRVAYIHPGSPFEKYGVTRGAMMTHIGGKYIGENLATGDYFDGAKLQNFNTEYAKSSNTFTFRLADGRDTSFSASRATSLKTNSYIAAKIFTEKDFPGLTRPVGYFNYLSFLNNFINDVSNNMEMFHDAGIKDLILDLRYNGGGDSRVSDRLINYLAPASAQGEVYVKRVHNDLLASYDEESRIGRYPKSLDLENLYVITGQGTASASELVINGLRPHMNVKMVGDTTYGKPNGMYVLMYPGDDASYAKYNKDDYSTLEWVFLPICFYNKNGKGESIPDSGFVPDCYRADDPFHDFTPEEASIKACLTHLVSGNYPEPPAVSMTRAGTPRGVDAKLEPVKNDPHYGLYTVRREFSAK